MLPKTDRLTSKKDFSRLFGKGRPQHHRLLILKVVRNGLDRSRVGFVVSTKTAKHAVDRNRIKRRMRDIVRRNMDRLRPGYDMAFIAKKDAVGCDFDDLRDAMVRTLEKAGVMSGEPMKK